MWVGNAPVFGGNTLWTAPGNWASGTIPPAGADLTFGTGFNSSPSINIFGDRTVGALTIDTTTPFVFVNSGVGGALTTTVSVGRTAASAGTQTFAVPVILPNSQTWSIAGGGGLALTGGLTAPGAALTLVGGGSLTLGGGARLDNFSVNDGAATIGGGTYEFQSGATSVNVGTAATIGSLTVQNGAVVNAAGRNGYTKISGTETVASKLTVEGTSAMWINGAEMDVGLAGQGQLNVQSNAHLGSASGGPFLLVVGAGAGGNGKLTISSGGFVFDSEGIISVDDASIGSAIVTGTDSTWFNQQELHIGGSNSSGQVGGPASLTIDDGGSVTAPHVNFWRPDAAVSINAGTLMTAGLVNRGPGGGGTLVLQADPAGGAPALTINSNATGENSVFFGSIVGAGTLSKSGASTQTLAGSNNFGRAEAHGGTIAISGSTRVGTLSVDAGARVDVFGQLMVTAAVDGLATNAANTLALAEVRSLVAAAYHNGAWDGNGITSLAAAGNSRLAIGYARLFDIGTGGGGGISPRGTPAIPPQTILVRATLAGDATLDGVVDFNDLVKLAQHYNTAGNFWFQGDFTYDGVVDFNDLVKLAQNYNSKFVDAVPGATPEFAADVGAAFGSVPEPGVGAMVVGSVGMYALMRRRAQRCTGRAKG